MLFEVQHVPKSFDVPRVLKDLKEKIFVHLTNSDPTPEEGFLFHQEDIHPPNTPEDLLATCRIICAWGHFRNQPRNQHRLDDMRTPAIQVGPLDRSPMGAPATGQ